MDWDDTIYTGLFFQKEQPSLEQLEPVLEEGGPLALQKLGIEKQAAQNLIKDMM